MELHSPYIFSLLLCISLHTYSCNMKLLVQDSPSFALFPHVSYTFLSQFLLVTFLGDRCVCALESIWSLVLVISECRLTIHKQLKHRDGDGDICVLMTVVWLYI